MVRRVKRVIHVTLPILAAFLIFSGTTLNAQTVSDDGQGIKEQVDTLNLQIKSKRNQVKQLDSMISEYEDKIAQQQTQAASLENQAALLEDQIAKKKLDIQRSGDELDALKLELQALEVNISSQNSRLETQKEYASELIRQIRATDDVSPLEVLLTKRSLSAFFDRVNEIKRLEGDLSDALTRVKASKQDLESTYKARDEKRLALEDQTKQLKKDQLTLEAERNFKSSLADATKMKESEFQNALYELHQQQQEASDDISSIETKLKDKLDSIDQSLARGDALLNWPIPSDKGITVTCKFHDPEYPFRNLFEHPGTDLRAAVGTPVKAAAGGYVAWNKKGRLYGNYTMIIHPGNIATVYAHLSKFEAKPDTYVNRGDEIGRSGGMPGMAGAGLSTGPHLHFEVRQGGIPVDPQNYLPSL